MLSKDEVQFKLNQIGYDRRFTVIFMKRDGTQRKLTGAMEKPEGEPKCKTAVAVKEEDTGFWKSFRIDSVLSIKEDA